MIVLSLSILDLRTFDYSLPTLSVSGSLTRAGRSTVSYSLALHCPVSLGSGGESVKDAAKVVVVFEVPQILLVRWIVLEMKLRKRSLVQRRMKDEG